MRIARSGELAAMLLWPAGVLAGYQAQVSHEVFGMRKAPQIPELGDDGGGRQKIQPSERHQCFDYRKGNFQVWSR